MTTNIAVQSVSSPCHPERSESVVEGSPSFLLDPILNVTIQGDPSAHSLRSFAQDDTWGVG